MFFGRRVIYTIVVLASHLLLISLAITWFIQLLAIAINGSVSFIEDNPWILTAEIVIASLITIFGIVVFILQILKLREKRQGDNRRSP